MIKLILKDSDGGEAQFPLTGELIIGRGEDSDIVLNDSKVSRAHTRVYIDVQVAFIEDLGSTNGTFVNGKQISTKTPLKAGDLVSIGVNRLRIVETSPLMDYAATTSVSKTDDLGDDIPVRQSPDDREPPGGRPGKGRVSVPMETGKGMTFWLYLLIGGGIIALLICYLVYN